MTMSISLFSGQSPLASVLLFGLLAGGLARADQVNLTFNGNVISPSCTIDAGSTDIPVSLGTVAATTFIKAGDRASPTLFPIKLGSCPSGTRAASVTFDGTADDTDTTLLALDDGGAVGVAIELADITGKKIDIKKASDWYGLVTSGDNILTFQARYVATRIPVEAGKANATAQFTVNYQ